MSKDLYHGNYTVAKVNGTREVLTSRELQQRIDDGYDVEVVSSS